VNKTRSNPPRAVFFDLDGTLADSIHAMWQIFEAFHARHGVVTTRDEFNKYNGVSLEQAVAELRLLHSIKTPLDEMIGTYLAQVDRAYAEVLPVAGATELLAGLKEHGVFVALVTSNSRVRVDAWLAKQKLAELFEHVVCVEETSNAKPHPEPYLNAFAVFGGAAEDVCVIEDSALGAQAGCAAGLRTIIISQGQRSDEFPPGVEFTPSLTTLAKEFGLDRA